MNVTLKNRKQRIHDAMKNQNLDALLITDPYSIWYLTGIFLETEDRFFALYFDGDSEKFFINRLFVLNETDIGKIEFSDSDDLIALICENIIKEGNLGIDKKLPASVLIPLMNINPNLKFLIGSDCVDYERSIKDKSEIAAIKEVSAIADKVINMAFEFISEGTTEKQVAEYIDTLFAKEECKNAFPSIVSFGKHCAEPHHTPDDTVVIKGDSVLIDIGCRKNHYCSDTTRTWFFKTTPNDAAKVHDIVRRANEKAISKIRPGVHLGEIDGIARNLITQAGYGKYFTHRLGHFIGQTAHEWGELSAKSPLIAIPGMIFSVEPGIYIPNKFGIRIEDLVLVTDDGCEVLNTTDKHWHIL